MGDGERTRRGRVVAGLLAGLLSAGLLSSCSGSPTDQGVGASATSGPGGSSGTRSGEEPAAPGAGGSSGGPGTTGRGGRGRSLELPRAAFAPQGRYAVGRDDVVLVDPTRGTDARQGQTARPERTLPVRMLYPRAGDAGAPVADGAEALVGPFPLVVFSHGLGSNGAEYEELMGAVAAAGYVVAMPTYPLSSGTGGNYLDVVNQPEDVSFVIDSLLSLSGRSPAGAIDRRRIAVAGHSLGAVTSVGVTFHDRLRDDRVDAAIGYAGAQFDLGEGDYSDRPATPLLLVHGTRDAVLGIAHSDTIFEASQGPVAFLRLRGAGHVDIFFGEQGRLLLDATLAFLDAHLRDRPAALAGLPTQTRASGFASWRSRD